MISETNKSTSERQSFVVFEVADQRYAIQSSKVEQITAMAEVQRPLGASKILIGFLDLAGDLTAVICLRHLFGAAEAPIHLWSPLIVLKDSNRRIALLVDGVTRIVTIDKNEISPLPIGHSLNNCVEAVIRIAENSALVLSVDRLLLHQEDRVVTEIQLLAHERVREPEAAAV